jgi:hypothetical protein
MSPPGKESARPRPGKRAPKRFQRKTYSRLTRNASLSYLQLVLELYASGLLEPFRCRRCDALTLDPIGWNGPHQPLCEACADPQSL